MGRPGRSAPGEPRRSADQQTQPSRNADPLAHHVPVLLERCLELLAPGARPPRRDRRRCDARPGRSHRGPAARPPGAARRRAGPRPRGATPCRRPAGRLRRAVPRACTASTTSCPRRSTSLGIGRVDGILFDLGVSSMQLDLADRGFSYAQDAALDMRMDQSAGPTAADVLNTATAGELTRMLRAVRRRAVRRPDRPGDRPRARAGAVHDQRPARRPDPGHHPRARAAHRRQPGQADVPGAADRGQRASWTCCAAAIPAALDRLAPGGRLVVHELPQRRGPDRQGRADGGDEPAGAPRPAGDSRGIAPDCACSHPRIAEGVGG